MNHEINYNMDNNLKEIRRLVRFSKDKIIDRYYRFRINSLSDPYQIKFRKQPYKILFLLSHMRSGSSLLTHILNSNPDIIGYGETHLNYSSELDLKTLMFKVYWHIRDYNMQHKYVLDKVLHDHKFLQEDFLTSNNIYTIFLIREPQRTLASILDIKPHLTEEKAFDYYVQRLSTLERYAKLINSKDHSVLINYDQLVKQPDSVLLALRDFLGTKEDFSVKYKVLRTTGLRGIGDSSDNIKSGRIIKNPRKLDIKISQELVDKAMQSFHQCSITLHEYCKTIEI